MQSKYTGDIGDFGKHGLLRYLSGLTDSDSPEPNLTLGIVWYLRSDECCKKDGRITGYLKATNKNHGEFRACDPDLWNALKGLVDCGKRCIHELEKAEVLPEGTLFYSTPLDFPPEFLGINRAEVRERWLVAALKKVAEVDLVFLDPDNGIAPDNKSPTHQDSNKFLFPDDIRRFWGQGNSLVIYQHLAMGIRAEDFICQKVERLQETVEARLFVLRFKSRIFFVLLQDEHSDRVLGRIGRMLAGPWGRHLKEVPHV